jgi:hypothetical protein
MEDVKMSCKCDTINIVNDNNVIVVSHADGRDGKSAYQQAVEGGYTGTEQEFNCSLSLLADVKQVKENLVSAIEYKGGTSSADKSLQGIAEDIREIPNFDQWARLAGVLAGNYADNALTGYEQNIKSGFVEIIDRDGFFKDISKYRFQFWNLLEIFVSDTLEYISQECFSYCTSLRYIAVPNATRLDTNCLRNCVSLIELYAPEITNIGTSYGHSPFVLTTNLQKITLGKIDVYTNGFFYFPMENLRDLVLGQNINIDLALHNWTATNVIAERQSGIDELNENLYNNLLTKLYDHSTDGQTRTLRLGWLAHVTQENIDYANSKGWTLTT